MIYSIQNVIIFVGEHLAEIGAEEGQKMIDTAERLSFQQTLKRGAINEIFPDPEMRQRFRNEVATGERHQLYVEATEQIVVECMRR